MKVPMNMPQELKEKWVEALRSGEYKQGLGVLQVGGRFCCLGVLEMVADGNVECSAMPSPEWLRNHGVLALDLQLVSMNDTLGSSFREIADYIEKEVVGYEPAGVPG